MASEFSLPITAEGAVTAPSGVMAFTEPSAEAETFLDVGPVNTLEIPEFGWLLADGVNPLRVSVKGGIYDCGGIAPLVSMTLAVAGAARATTGIAYTGQPGDGESFTIGRASFSITVTYKSTLVVDGTLGHQIKIGASADATYTNLKNFLNNSGTHGTDYFNVNTYLGLSDDISDNYFMECSLLDTALNQLTIRYTQYGALGNSAVCVEVVPVANAAFVLTSDFATPSAVFAGGSDGTGSAPSAGTFRYFYTWFRDVDGAETFRSPITTITQTTNTNIAISGLTASADTSFDFIRIYRTAGSGAGSGVEFYLLGAVPRASTTFTDSITDLLLVQGLRWNELLYRIYGDGMPPRGLALAFWKGRAWSIGAWLHADYTKGTVAVVGVTTTPSATVTFSLKGVTSLMRGMTFQVAATSETYRIISVSETGPTAVLNRAYQGADNATASFKIMDDYDAAKIRATPEFLFNQWPEDESPGRIDTDDPAGGKALLATKSRLFVFSKTSIAAVTGDGPESWEISKISDQVGCVATRLVVGLGDGAVFLAKDGFWALSPDESMTSLSSPKGPAKVIAQGIDGTVGRINWACVDQGYARYDVEEGTIVFGLPLDGATVPNYEIVFDTQNSTWTTFKRAEWTALAPAVLPGGGNSILAGDRDGVLWHADIGESDGFYGQEAVATLTGAQTTRVLTCSTASWTTTGDALKGIPIAVLYADAVTVAYGKIASNTGTALTLAEDLSTAPAAGDQVIVGAIHWKARSGFPTFGEEYRKKGLRSVTARHSPTTRGEYFLAFAVDSGSFSLPPVGTGIGSLAQADGKVRHMIQWPGDSHAIQMQGFKPGGRAVLRGGVYDIVVREQPKK